MGLGKWRPHPNPDPPNPPIANQELARGYAPALLPGWGNVTPFTLLSAAQFWLPGPPALTSEAYARDYNEVSLNSMVNKPLYYPVEAGSVEQFGAIIDKFSDDIVAQVQGAAKGQMVPGSARAAKSGGVEKPSKVQSGTPTASTTAMAEDTRLLGLAMQLAYLGRQQGARAPELIDAWAIDRDLEHPTSKSLEVRVLLTKNQLSDLQVALPPVEQQ
jgi:hypothetical protein